MTPKQLVAHLEVVVGISGRPRRLLNCMEDELRQHFGLPAVQAAEVAERLEVSVRDLIIVRQEEAQSNGVLSILTLADERQRSVCGSCWEKGTDSAAVREGKKRRLQVEPMLTIIRNLSFREFEHFGAKVLKVLGASTSYVTPQSNDQGIDFYGTISLGQYAQGPAPFFKLAHDVSLRFAGQAKHYPNIAVGPAVVRELIGSIALARYRVFTRGPEMFENLSLLPMNPLLCMIFTTGRFTKGAMEIAEKAGVIVRSGEQLAVFLADCGVGYVEGVFNPDTFHEWLSK